MSKECSLKTSILMYIHRYLYKYLFKGVDKTMFAVRDIESVNEIDDYIQARYLSASEAMWHIFQYDITGKIPAVIGLDVHLPGRNLPQMIQRNGLKSVGSSLL